MSMGVLRKSIDDSTLNAEDKYELFSCHLKKHLPQKLRLNSQEGSADLPGFHGGRSSLPAPWWNDACQEAVDLRRRLLSTFKKSPSYSNYLAFKRQEAVSRRVLRAEKRKGWRDYRRSLTFGTPVTHIWRTIKRFKNRHMGIPVSPPCSSLVIFEEIRNSVNSMCPSSSAHRLYFFPEDFLTDYICKMFESPFSYPELISAVRSVKVHGRALTR